VRRGRNAAGYYSTVPPTDQQAAVGANGTSRRRIGQLVRRATLASYGVASVSGPRWYHRLLAWLGRATPGVRVDTDGRLGIELHVSLARGVPAAAVVSNIEERVRYVVQRELGREIHSLTVYVNGRPYGAGTAGGRS